ncbi:Tup N-terminal-domain-containing protein [Hyaloraphidium curvatum]|nr:Tup N-terminal-domain-containing protein [Hyaloraphidium curvatum]
MSAPPPMGMGGPSHRAAPGNAGGAVAQLAAHAAQHAPASHRLPELLEAIKAEFQTLADEMHVYKMQRDEYAEKFTAQVNELSQIRGNLFDLERIHNTIKQQYEEDIMRLRRELEAAGINPSVGARPGGPLPPKPEFAGAAPALGGAAGASPAPHELVGR